jgi:hypothetical protein
MSMYVSPNTFWTTWTVVKVGMNIMLLEVSQLCTFKRMRDTSITTDLGS